MSTLNLEPSGSVLLVQFIVFLTNLAVIKKFFIGPFLKIYEKRYALSIGSQAEAEKLGTSSDETMAAIEEKMKRAYLEIKDIRAKEIERAKKEHEAILNQAEKAAKSLIDDNLAVLKAQLDVEKKKIPPLVAALSSELYEKAMQA